MERTKPRYEDLASESVRVDETRIEKKDGVREEEKEEDEGVRVCKQMVI